MNKSEVSHSRVEMISRFVLEKSFAALGVLVLVAFAYGMNPLESTFFVGALSWLIVMSLISSAVLFVFRGIPTTHSHD